MKQNCNIVAVVATKNPRKVQVEFAQQIVNPTLQASSSANELLQLLNASDSRFSDREPKQRRAWLGAEKTEVKTLFGIDCTKLATWDGVSAKPRIEILKENVQIAGRDINIQITETTVLTAKQVEANPSPKTKGKGGEIVTHGGKPVYSFTAVLFDEPKHTFLAGDTVAVGAPAVTSEINDMA